MLARDGWRAVARSLAIPPDGGGQSLLGPSLHAVFDRVDRLPNPQHTLAVFSDFLLFDHDLADMYEELGSSPGSLHAARLRSTPPLTPVDNPRVTVTRITRTLNAGASP